MCYWEGIVLVLKRLKTLVICVCLLVIAIYSLANFNWHYYIWDTRYYKIVHDVYLSHFPQAREVSSKSNLLTTITLRSSDFFALPHAKIYVNDHRISDLRDGQITLIVTDGDRIHLDTSFYNRELNFEFVATSENIVYPKAGNRFTLLPQVNFIGEIIKATDDNSRR